MENNLDTVQEYWNREACGAHYIKDYTSREDFFKQYRDFRYTTEWHIPQIVSFSSVKGKKVLEIGCGNGVDGAMFALNGGNYTGVDLTQAAVDATNEYFKLLDLVGDIRIENAENLSFPDNYFDIVYSHGVLHHTPNYEKAISEVYRVLKNNGQAIIMLYHKNSFNYYVRIMLYMRIKLLFYILVRIHKRAVDKRQKPPAQDTFISNKDSRVLKVHYRNFLQNGWSYLKSNNFVHHCTDGPECPFAFVFTKSDVKTMFFSFKNIETVTAHFPIRSSQFTRWIPFFVEKFLASKLGFYLFIIAEK